MIHRRTSPWFLAIVLLASCSKAPPPPPDGSSGVRGVCLLASEPPDEDGRDVGRRPWAGVRVNVRECNNPEGNDPHTYSATTDVAGRFRIALNPGEYSLGIHDPEHLAGKMHSPLGFKVVAGEVAELVVDWDNLNIRDLPPR